MQAIRPSAQIRYDFPQPVRPVTIRFAPLRTKLQLANSDNSSCDKFRSGEQAWQLEWIADTNIELDFFKAYEIHSMRWCIEVCFAEMKSLLNLGKCQARNFTEQIASISLCAMQYNILGYVKRFDSYETIGGLFADTTSGTKELSIVDKIWLLIIEVISSIAEQISADYDELMTSAINGNKHLKILFEPYLTNGVTA